jgi:hypothetical protein
MNVPICSIKHCEQPAVRRLVSLEEETTHYVCTVHLKHFHPRYLALLCSSLDGRVIADREKSLLSLLPQQLSDPSPVECERIYPAP